MVSGFGHVLPNRLPQISQIEIEKLDAQVFSLRRQLLAIPALRKAFFFADCAAQYLAWGTYWRLHRRWIIHESSLSQQTGPAPAFPNEFALAYQSRTREVAESTNLIL